jgi:capsular polysaccharide transport system permease protein
MIFTLGVTILWVATRGLHASSLPIVPFALTGYSTILLWRNAANRCAKAIEPNRALLFHRNVTVLDLMLARLVLEISGATIALVALAILFILTGWMTLPANLLTLIVGWFLMIWFSVGLGMIVGALTEISEAFERVWHIMTYLMFPLSGAMFMVDWLPKNVQEYALWVPMIHGVEMMRDGYYGTMVRTYYSVPFFFVVSSIMVGIGLILVNRLKSLEGSN